jgi:hypothetical protein
MCVSVANCLLVRRYGSHFYRQATHWDASRTRFSLAAQNACPGSGLSRTNRTENGMGFIFPRHTSRAFSRAQKMYGTVVEFHPETRMGTIEDDDGKQYHFQGMTLGFAVKPGMEFDFSGFVEAGRRCAYQLRRIERANARAR